MGGHQETQNLAKLCPVCKAGYSSDMHFCPQDGSALVANKPVETSEPEFPPSNGSGSENSQAETELSAQSEFALLLSDDKADGETTKTLNTNGSKVGAGFRLDLVGQTVEDRYEVTDEIGQGGMSVVYKARDRRLRKIVAIKVLMPHLAADPLSVQRFQQEATAASHLDHPNIVKVYNVGATESGLPFMAMDYLEGRSLSSQIKEKGRIAYEESLNIFVQLTGALAHAHEKGVIHRDLKPSNVILAHQGNETDVAKLVDFGIAKVLSQDGHTQAKLTQTGDVFGSPHYMSPEQCLGGELDERSDVYSMGCLMYETVTGRPPHTGESTLQILHKHISETPASFKNVIPEHAKNSAQLEAIVFKCLAPKRDDRFQNMNLLKKELSNLYMDRGSSPIDQAMARISLAWSKRPKFSRREKLLAASGILVSALVLGSSWFTYSFFELTRNSPWLSPNIITWIPPKPPPGDTGEKMTIAYSQVDIYVKRRSELLKAGVITAPELVKTLTKSGLGFERAGRYEDAARCLEIAAEVAEDKISKRSTSYANLLFYRGRVYYQWGKYDSAAACLFECINNNQWPVSDLTRGECEALLADSYSFLGKRNDAEEFYERALKRWEGYDPSRFSITAARYGDLVALYNTPKANEYAYKLYLSAKRNWRRSSEEEVQNIALCDLRIADLLAISGQRDESYNYLKSANQEFLSVFGTDSPKRATTMMKFADALWSRGDYVNALKERFNCWAILNHAPPPVTTREI